MAHRLAVESLEARHLLAGLVVQGTDGADVFEFSLGSVTVNGVEQTYDVSENPVVVLDGLSGDVTESACLTGSLSTTGDVTTTAARVQTAVLGDASYSAPDTSACASIALRPSVTTVTTASETDHTNLTAGATYEYRLVWACDAAVPTTYNTESMPSDSFSQTVGADGDSIEFSGLPTTAPSDSYTHLSIYRRNAADATAGNEEYYYVGQVAKGTTTFTDTLDDATAQTKSTLDQRAITGAYQYAVTYVAADGTESRPSPVSNSVILTNGRVTLDELPYADTSATEWRTRKIYRTLADDSEEYHLVAEIDNMDSDVVFVDNLSDADISSNETLDLDGPKITSSTSLVDVLLRDGWTYDSVFEEGTISVAFTKGGRELPSRDLTITSETTVWDLIDFVASSAGILPPAADPENPIPGAQDTTVSGATISPGGLVQDGRIVITSNNGPANAVEIELPGLTFTESASADGEGAAADLLVFDDEGNTQQLLLTTALEGRDATTATYRWFVEESTGLVTFDSAGGLLNATNTTVTLTDSFSFELDFSDLTAGESSLGAAQDTIILHGASSDETVSIQPGSAVLAGTTFEVQACHFAAITVEGGGGVDVAELLDSPRSDHLVASAEAATLSGPGYRNRVEGFRTVHGYARSGGIDVAELFDGEGDDRFVATPTCARLVLDTQSADQGLLRAKFFDYVHAYAKQGGRDAAYLADSAGDDIFVRANLYGKLRGDGFQNRAKFFEAVSATSSAGSDEARLIAQGDARLRASGSRATLSGAVVAAAYHFDWVRAISTADSNSHDLEAIDYLLTLYGPWS